MHAGAVAPDAGRGIRQQRAAVAGVDADRCLRTRMARIRAATGASPARCGTVLRSRRRPRSRRRRPTGSRSHSAAASRCGIRCASRRAPAFSWIRPLPFMSSPAAAPLTRRPSRPEWAPSENPPKTAAEVLSLRAAKVSNRTGAVIDVCAASGAAATSVVPSTAIVTPACARRQRTVRWDRGACDCGMARGSRGKAFGSRPVRGRSPQGTRQERPSLCRSVTRLVARSAVGQFAACAFGLCSLSPSCGPSRRVRRDARRAVSWWPLRQTAPSSARPMIQRGARRLRRWPTCGWKRPRVCSSSKWSGRGAHRRRPTLESRATWLLQRHPVPPRASRLHRAMGTARRSRRERSVEGAVPARRPTTFAEPRGTFAFSYEARAERATRSST